MPQYAARADENQADLVRMARELGAEVQHLHAVGQGCPDLLVAHRGHWFVVEVKTKEGHLTDAQLEWHEKFGDYAPVYTWRSCDDVVRTLLHDWTPEEIERGYSQSAA